MVADLHSDASGLHVHASTARELESQVPGLILDVIWLHHWHRSDCDRANDIPLVPWYSRTLTPRNEGVTCIKN
jgi:hypothetical protein